MTHDTTCWVEVARWQQFPPFFLFCTVPHPCGTVWSYADTRKITHPQACKCSQAISWNTEAQTLGTEGRVCAAEWQVITVGWSTAENISGACGLLLRIDSHYAAI